MFAAYTQYLSSTMVMSNLVTLVMLLKQVIVTLPNNKAISEIMSQVSFRLRTTVKPLEGISHS